VSTAPQALRTNSTQGLDDVFAVGKSAERHDLWTEEAKSHGSSDRGSLLSTDHVFSLKSLDIHEEFIETCPHIEHECLEYFDILN